MKLRRLELKDKKLMLEWMHDFNVVQNMRTDFCNKTEEDCEAFIQSSWENTGDLHLAIVDESDMYLGTVSLKHINLTDKMAEFAITVRQCAMGTGVAAHAMKLLLDYGNDRMGIKKIYWCVNSKNARAIRFYDKNGYQRVLCVPESIRLWYQNQLELVWYLWEK